MKSYNSPLGVGGFAFHFFIAGHQFSNQFSIPPYFIPISFMNKQHTEAFSMMPIEMFVMHFMRPANGPDI